MNIGLRGILDINEFNQNVRAFIGGINQITAGTTGVASSTVKGMSSAITAVTGLKTAFSAWDFAKLITGITLLQRGIDFVTKSLGGMIQEGLKAVDTFQRLNFTLRGILARDFAREFGGSVGDAFLEIEQKAKELFGWIRRIAITTPFSVESLTTAVSMGQAFGFNVAQAKQLILAVGEFTAGMGLTQQNFDRIIYNMGQMLASGKVLGRELRDLANNFVPVQDVIQRIADVSKKSFAEVREAMKNGQISADQFISTFVKMAEEDFSGAMERMSRTLSGVSQNFKDFFHTVIGIEILGPIGTKVAEILSSLLDKLFQPEVTDFFRAVGVSLSRAFTTITDAIRPVLKTVGEILALFNIGGPSTYGFARAILYLAQIWKSFFGVLNLVLTKVKDFIEDLKRRFSVDLGSIANNAKGWGANIIISFARGMADAIVYVLRVISQLARAISSWLQGHSPPRFLPDLDKWGKSAMEEYLKGWLTADFEIFNDITSIVTDFMKSIHIDKDDTGFIPRLLGTREAIMKAVGAVKESGDITVKAMRDIFKAAKITNPYLKDYIRALLKFTEISTKSSHIEAILDFDIEKNIPANIFGEVVDSVEDLVKLGSKLGSVLGPEVINYIDKAKALADANRSVEMAQAFLNGTVIKYDTILRSLNKQLDALTKKQEDNNRIADIDRALATGRLTVNEKARLELEKQELQLRQNIRTVESEKSIAEAAAQSKLDSAEEAQEEAEAAAEAQRALVQQTTEAQVAAAKEQLEAAKAIVDFQIENNELMKEQLELLKRLAEARKGGGAGGGGEPWDLEKFGEDLGDQLDEAITDSLPTIEDAIVGLEKYIQDEWNDFWRQIRTPFNQISFSGVGDAINDAFNSFLESDTAKSISAFFVVLEGLISKVGKAVGDTLDPMFDSLGKTVKGLSPQFKNFFKALAPLGDFFVFLVKVLGGSVLLTIVMVGGAISGLISAVVRGLQGASLFLDDLMMGIAVLIDGFKNVFTGISDILRGFLSFITMEITGAQFGEIFKEKFRQMAEGAKEIAIGLMYSIGSVILGAVTTILGFFYGLVEGIVKFFKNLWKRLVGNSIVPDMLEDIIDAISEWVSDTWEKFREWVEGVVDIVVGFADDFLASGKELISNLIEGARQMIEDVGGFLDKIWTWMTEAAKKIVASDIVQSFLENGKELVRSIMEGFRQLIYDPLGFLAKISEYIAEGAKRVVSNIPSWVQAGVDLIGGIISGIGQSSQKLWTAIVNLVRKALGLGEEEAGADSPADEWKPLGKSMVEGIAYGVTTNREILFRAMTDLLLDLKNTMGASSLTLTPAIIPSVSKFMRDQGLSVPFAYSGGYATPGNTYIDKRTYIEMDANYKTVESEASVYYDISAAFAAARL